ncbi:MAG: dihydrodipicolinate synthase family protein [Gemmataceae bacterium]
MTSATLPTPLRGVIPPLATPLADPDRLDHAGLERLIDHVLAGGVHGLFLLGTTGEAPALSYRLRCELIERACDQVAGRVPVLVGISDTSLTESVQLAEHAADAGAAAVVATPPYYFPLSQPEVAAYLEQLAAALPLPLFLYNIPSCARNPIDVDTLARLLDMPRIVGMKDSLGQMVFFHRLLQTVARRPDFTLLMGPEELLGEATLLGAHGGICGGANLAPRLYVALYEAARAGDLPRVRALQTQVMRLSSSLYHVGGSTTSAYLRGMKAALSVLGLCGPTLAAPLQPFGPAEMERVRAAIDDLDLAADYATTAGAGAGVCSPAVTESV